LRAAISTSTDAILSSLARQQPIDLPYRTFDPGAEGLMGLAKLDQLAIVPRRAPRFCRCGFDTAQGPFDPFDCGHRPIV
jgi:hypothetical protein